MEWGEAMSYREDRGGPLVHCIGLLGKTGRYHGIDTGCQWRQGGFRQLTRQPDLLRREDCQRIKQGCHRFSLGHLGLVDKAEHHALHLLPSERHFYQVTRLHLTLKLRRQVVVKGAAHLRNINCDFYIGGHLVRRSIVQALQA